MLQHWRANHSSVSTEPPSDSQMRDAAENYDERKAKVPERGQKIEVEWQTEDDDEVEEMIWSRGWSWL